MMTLWQKFYSDIRGENWPDCDREEDFSNLPSWIQEECQHVHNYTPGEYRFQPKFEQKVFPIKTDTACQLKWNWSTIFLTIEETASCHRTDHHEFDTEKFDFHNTPRKLDDRRKMLDGQWPDKGCEYCKNIEAAGGQSDRITNLDLPGMVAPPELDQDPNAVAVTPRILEVYFDNTCNLKCLYCGPSFSSLWDVENKKHGKFQLNGLVINNNFKKSPRIEENKTRLFKWLETNGKSLTNFNFLGGEPLFQKDLDDCLDHFKKYPAPNLEFQIFSNLNCRPERLDLVIKKIQDLVDQGHMRSFTVTASLDCWGAAQEYTRYPLDLEVWTKNFETLLSHEWIKLVIGSTITPLTIKTFPDLISNINRWRQTRPVYHYMNSVNSPSYMFIDIFGDLFQEDFNRAAELMQQNDQDQIKIRNYLLGIALQSKNRGVNKPEVLKLLTFLEEMDRRRGTDWKTIFPWLETAFEQILGKTSA